jgi:subtilase family serine protease
MVSPGRISSPRNESPAPSRLLGGAGVTGRRIRSVVALSIVPLMMAWSAAAFAQPKPARPAFLPPPPVHPIAGQAHLPLRSSLVGKPVSRSRPGQGTASTSVVYTPANILSAYDFGSMASGSGQSIALIEAHGDPSLSTDLSTFDTQWGLPAASVSVYTVDGNPGPNSSWALETALDVEWAHAEAPAAKIDVIEAANSSFQDLLDAIAATAQQLAPNEISMSWGGPESDYASSSCTYAGTTTTCQAAFEAALQAAQAKGIVLLASSGDSGAYDNGTSLSVNYPASSPEVMGVGGTTLTLSSAGGYGSETAWVDSGGGYSSVYPTPSYQPAGLPSRGVPDVAFDADPNTGVYVYQGGSWYAVGGTSFGAPSWAAIAADSASGAKVSLARMYQVYGSASYGADMHDVTTGNNGYYSAGPGWDAATGIGTPDVAHLLSAPPAVSLSLSPASQAETIASGGAASYTLTLSNSGVSGTVSLGGSTPPSGWSVAGLPATVTVSPGVATTFTISVSGTGAAGTSFADTIIATQGSLSASATATTSILLQSATLTASGSTAGSGPVGGTVSYAYTLTNTGNGNDAFTLTASSASGWGASVSPTPVTLAPGASQTVTLTVTIPAAAAVGSSDTETVTASDGSGALASATATTSVVAQATTVAVTSIGYTPQGSGLGISVALQNNLGQPVSGASVSIEVYLNGKAYASGTGTTGSAGTVAFGLRRAPKGTYTTTVTKVSAAGLTWNGVTPSNSYTKG